MKTKIVIRNCEFEFKFVCPKTWGQLTPTDISEGRHCNQCQQNVYYCITDEETIEHARSGHCIARKMPDHSELFNRIFVGQVNDGPRPTPEQLEAGKLASRESGILDSIHNARRSTRACPECHYPAPDWRSRCRVCGYEIGRVKRTE